MITTVSFISRAEESVGHPRMVNICSSMLDLSVVKKIVHCVVEVWRWRKFSRAELALYKGRSNASLKVNTRPPSDSQVREST
jgi:hypothetical protein